MTRACERIKVAAGKKIDELRTEYREKENGGEKTLPRKRERENEKVNRRGGKLERLRSSGRVGGKLERALHGGGRTSGRGACREDEANRHPETSGSSSHTELLRFIFRTSSIGNR